MIIGETIYVCVIIGETVYVCVIIGETVYLCVIIETVYVCVIIETVYVCVIKGETVQYIFDFFYSICLNTVPVFVIIIFSLLAVIINSDLINFKSYLNLIFVGF